MPVSGEEPITSFFPRLRTWKENVYPVRYPAKRKRVDVEANEPAIKRAKVKEVVFFRGGTKHRENAAQSRAEIAIGLVDNFALRQASGMQGVDQPSTSPQASTLTSRVESGPRTSLVKLESSSSCVVRTRKGSEVTFSGTQDEDRNIHSFSTWQNDMFSVKDVNSTHSGNARRQPSLLSRGAVSAISTKSPEASESASGMSRMSPSTPSSSFRKRHYVAAERSSQLMLTSLSRGSGVADIIDNESDVGPAEEPSSLLALSQMVVPSSQTLDVDFAYSKIAAAPSSISTMGLMTSSPTFKLPPLPICHGQLSKHGIRRYDASHAEPPEHRFIPSSQTQHMVPYDVSPRRVRPLRSSPLLLKDDRQVTLDEVVSSSQSQIEKELNLSRLFSNRSSPVQDTPLANVSDNGDRTDHQELSCDTIRGGLSTPPSTTAHILSRRLPEEWSSKEKITTPVQEPDFLDLFEEDSNGVFEPEGQTTESKFRSEVTLNITPIPNFFTKHDPDDSATESDEEQNDLGLPPPSNRQTGSAASKDTSASSPPLPKSPTGSTSFIPDGDELDCWDNVPHVPDALAAGLGSITNTETNGSLGSLPQVVKDFRDMFGSGEGSYPDDFPMSLRW